MKINNYISDFMWTGNTWLGESFGVFQFMRTISPTLFTKGVADARCSTTFSESN